MNELQKHIINVNNFCDGGSCERLTYLKIMSVLDSDSSKRNKLEMLMNDDFLNGLLLENKQQLILKAIQLLKDGIKFEYHKFWYKINILDEYSKKINGFGLR